MEQFVFYEQTKHVAVVTINRPPVNALNRVVIDQLGNCFNELGKVSELRAVVLTGKGKSFIAGADIAEMPGWTIDEAEWVTRKGQQIFTQIESFRVPVIAAVNGYALGGGLELAMACDIRIFSEKAKLGLPEVSLGIIPGYGGTQRLQRIVPKGMAKYMIFSAEPISASRALQIGLADEVVEADGLMHRAMKIAEIIASKGPIAVGAAKHAMNKGANIPLQEGMDIEAESVRTSFSSVDSKEGIQAFLEKRKPNFHNM